MAMYRLGYYASPADSAITFHRDLALRHNPAPPSDGYKS